MNEKRDRISASVSKLTIAAIVKLAEKEKRSFSHMVEILLGESIENRKPIQHQTKSKN